MIIKRKLHITKKDYYRLAASLIKKNIPFTSHIDEYTNMFPEKYIHFKYAKINDTITIHFDIEDEYIHMLDNCNGMYNEVVEFKMLYGDDDIYFKLIQQFNATDIKSDNEFDICMVIIHLNDGNVKVFKWRYTKDLNGPTFTGRIYDIYDLKTSTIIKDS